MQKIKTLALEILTEATRLEVMKPSESTANTLIPRKKQSNFQNLEKQWHAKRAKTIKNRKPFESLGQGQYFEISDSNVFPLDTESDELPNRDYEEGFTKRMNETPYKWFERLYIEIKAGLNPILTLKGLNGVIKDLAQQEQFQKPSQLEIKKANENFKLLQRMFQDIDDQIRGNKNLRL